MHNSFEIKVKIFYVDFMELMPLRNQSGVIVGTGSLKVKHEQFKSKCINCWYYRGTIRVMTKSKTSCCIKVGVQYNVTNNF